MLYYINHPYYPNRNKRVDLFAVSIIIIITIIYDSRWRVFSWPRFPAIGRKYTYDLPIPAAFLELHRLVWRIVERTRLNQSFGSC